MVGGDGEDSGFWGSASAGDGEYEGCASESGERIFRQGNERRTMKLNFDKQADALFLRLDDSKILESEEVAPGIVLDFNENNEVVGVEILGILKRTGGSATDLVELTGLVPV
jgi:uncharacterized protein YuzE